LFGGRCGPAPRRVSAYIRAAALAGSEFEMRSFEEQRELRNALIRIALVLETYPATPLLTETFNRDEGCFRQGQSVMIFNAAAVHSITGP